jgi:peptide chain release factor 1
MANTLIDKLEELDRHLAETDRQMQDPAIATDGAKIVALSKEHSQLARIVEPYRAYKTPAAEIDSLQRRTDEAMECVKGLLVMSEDDEIGSIILEIRAGTGGEEAALFAGDLLTMYRRFCEKHGWSFEILSASPTDLGGFREVVANIKGDGAWTHLGYEGGGHRVQRVPKTETQGRIHTSAATVAVLPEPKEIDIQINWDTDVLEHTSRAGGPGGQNVNKVESAIRLEHLATGITVSMRDDKSQHKNRAKARRIMAVRLYEHFHSKQMMAEAAARKAMIGSGDRSQRVRTYNFPQNRCTDHRLKGEGSEGANFNLQSILDGNLDELVDALTARDKAERLANL